MKEKPILFSAEMVRAILDGRKTQTRRVIKPQPDSPVVALGFWQSDADGSWAWRYQTPIHDGVLTWNNCRLLGKNGKCPYGTPGDHLWVCETWGLVTPESAGERWHNLALKRPTCLHPESNPVDGIARAIYRADGKWEFATGYQKWRPSIFMPRWASRITLEIISVRVERVQDISKQDAYAEGIGDPEYEDEIAGPCLAGIAGGCGACQNCDSVFSFKLLWNEINAKRDYSWNKNPWVWVIEFKRLET